MSAAGRRRVRAMVRRNLLVQMRNPGHWFLLLVLPLVDGLLFGSIGVAFGEGEAPVELLVTGIMLFHLIWQLTLAGSLGLLEEVWSRNLMNLIATPLTEREFMGSLGIVGLLRTVVSVTVIALVGLGFYAVAPDSAGWVLVPAAAILLLFGWAITLFVTALTLQYGDSAEVFSWGTLVLLMPLSGVFYPIDSLPPVLRGDRTGRAAHPCVRRGAHRPGGLDDRVGTARHRRGGHGRAARPGGLVPRPPAGSVPLQGVGDPLHLTGSGGGVQAPGPRYG